MYDSTTSSALQTFQSSRNSWIWRSCCLQITTSIVSYKSQSLKHCKPSIHFQLRTMKYQTRLPSELLSSIDFPILLKLMVKVFLILISIRPDSNSSTLTKSFQLQQYSHPKSKKSQMETKARTQHKIGSKTTEKWSKRMLRQLRA